MPLPKELPRAGRAAGGPGAPAAPSSARGERQGSAGVDGRRVLANRYRLGQKLGSGAFGCAYLVFDLKLNGDKWATHDSRMSLYKTILLTWQNEISHNLQESAEADSCVRTPARRDSGRCEGGEAPG